MAKKQQAVKSNQQQLTLVYETADSYKQVLCDGALFVLRSNQHIDVTFYSELPPIPKATHLLVERHGDIAKIVNESQVPQDHRQRLVHITTTMTPDVAIQLRDKLDEILKSHVAFESQVQAAQTQEGLFSDSNSED